MNRPERRDRPGRVLARAARGRARLVLAAVAGIALAGLGLSSIERVAEGERAFLRTLSARGAATRLAPGRHVVLRFVQRVERFPDGPVAISSSVRLRAREGIDLEVPFDVEARLDDRALAAFLGTAGPGRPPREAMEAAASAALAEWGAGAAAESLVLQEGARQVQTEVRGRLEGLGFTDVALRLGPTRGAGDTAAAIAARALRGRTIDTRVKIALLGLDGADWEIIDPLIAKGQLPNLARLKRRGAWGDMETMMPALSPLLWTTIATGRPPEEHGITDFLVKDTKTGRLVPISGRSRKVKALWNIFTDAGRTTAFIAWWATWPAEPVAGYMVSDRVAYSLFDLSAAGTGSGGTTYPEGYLQAIRPMLVDDRSLALEDLKPFAEVTPDEITGLRRRALQDPGSAYREPLGHLGRILASARSYQAIALDVLQRGQPDLFAVYYQGIDEVCHRFAHCMPPKMDMVSTEEHARYRDTVFAYYRHQDRLLGDILARLSPDTVVFVLSDHGFLTGDRRPRKEPPFVDRKPGLWHRRHGILIAAGPPVRPGRLEPAHLPDVAPTVLYLSGLPVPDDMQGRVLKEAIAPDFLRRVPLRAVPSYEPLGRPLEQKPAVAAQDAAADDEAIARLRSLGYVGGGGEGAAPAIGDGRGGEEEALLTAHLNEAGLHLEKGDYARARASLQKVFAVAPDLVPALLLLVNVEVGSRNPDRAIEVARRVIALDPEADRRIYDELGHIYIGAGRAPEGIAYFRGLTNGSPRVPEIRATLGWLFLHEGRTQEADQAFGEALRIDPDHPTALAGLGALQGRSGRLEEAVANLGRAVALDPDNLEAWQELGAAQVRLGRPRDAIRSLETARAQGLRSTALYNALALSYLGDHQEDRAAECLSESLRIDPDQKDAADLLRRVSRPPR